MVGLNPSNNPLIKEAIREIFEPIIIKQGDGKMVYTKDDAFKLLLESVNNSTEEIYRLRKREINLLKQLLEADKKVSALIENLAEKTFPKEEKSHGKITGNLGSENTG